MLSTNLMRSITRTTVRYMSSTSRLSATTELTMPALSPTMTEGTVTEWKFKLGESFNAGDVLLQIETDKASIEVEAQDDGIMGMILVPNETSGVQVGAVIALLIEEGDDINALKAPVPSTSTSTSTSASPSPPSPPTPTPSPPSPPPEAPSPQVTPPSAPSPSTSSANLINLTHPHHPQPLLPSVHRLLVLNKIEDATVIIATGAKGLLTKGDVLAFLGRIDPIVEKVEKKARKLEVEEKKVEKKVVEEILGGNEIRRLIAFGLGNEGSSGKKVKEIVPGFDQVLDEYLPLSMRSKSSSSSNKIGSSIPGKKTSFDNFLDL